MSDHVVGAASRYCVVVVTKPLGAGNVEGALLKRGIKAYLVVRVFVSVKGCVEERVFVP